MAVKTTYKYLFVTLLCLLFSDVAIAACASKDIGPFTLAANDKSIEFLELLFGQFDYCTADFRNVKAMAVMFKIYTGIILNVGLFILAYVVFTTVARTAMSGKFLGEKGNLWTPLRVVAGLILLVQKPIAGAGYILIQAIFMWIVYAGIGAADMVWNVVSAELSDKSIYTMSSSGATSGGGAGSGSSYSAQQIEDMNKVRTNAISLTKALLCVNDHNVNMTYFDTTAQKNYHAMPQLQNDPDLSPLYGDLTTPMSSAYMWTTAYNAVATIQNMDQLFRWQAYGIYDAGQGLYTTVTLNFGNLTSASGINNDCGELKDLPIEKFSYYLNFLNAINPVIVDIMPQYKSSGTNYELGLGLTDAQKDIIRGAMIDFSKCLEYGKGNNDCLSSSTGLPQTDIGKMGWMSAGFYYAKMARRGLGGSDTVTKDPITNVNVSLNVTTPNFENLATILIGNTEVEATSGSAAGNPLGPLYDDAVKNMYGGGKPSDIFVTIVTAPITALISQSWVKMMSSVFTTTGDPFQQAVSAGGGLLLASFSVLITALLTIYLTSLAANVCGGQVSPGEATNTVLQYIAILTMSLSATMFAEGALLGIFLPLIPMVIWTVGVIGWFFAVVEAMAAAPIVAIGIMWPEAQNEVFGRGEPALMLLLNIFLRPMLLLIGLLMGMLVCRIAFSLAGLMLAIAASLSQPVIRPDLIFGWIAVGFMFGYALIVIAQKSFSLVHEIPDKVLVWIGGQVVPWGGADEGVAALKGGIQKGGSPGKGLGQAGKQDWGTAKGGKSTSVE